MIGKRVIQIVDFVSYPYADFPTGREGTISSLIGEKALLIKWDDGYIGEAFIEDIKIKN